MKANPYLIIFPMSGNLLFIYQCFNPFIILWTGSSIFSNDDFSNDDIGINTVLLSLPSYSFMCSLYILSDTLYLYVNLSTLWSIILFFLFFAALWLEMMKLLLQKINWLIYCSLFLMSSNKHFMHTCSLQFSSLYMIL